MKMDTTLFQNMDRTAAPNSTFAIDGVSFSAGNFVVAESTVFRINICGKIPAFAKRPTFMLDTKKTLLTLIEYHKTKGQC